MALKVFQSSGRGDAAKISQGINYARIKGATVINMSFGSYSRSITMESALANAYASCVLVAAAGNDARDIGDCLGAPFYPAALSFVLGVMAPDGSFSNFDCTGPTYSLSAELNNYEMKAPGTNILSTIPNGNYRVYQGTSMAAPILAASLAMYKTLFPTQSQEMMWVKFIQSTGMFFNLDSAIHCIPHPEIRIISRTLVDTLNNDDHDGRVDAGETIQIWFTARNTGGQCDSTWFKIRFHEFEDTTTAQIIKSTSFIGSMSAYATRTSQFDPIKIHFSPNIAHDRDVVFDLLSWYKGSTDTVVQQIVFNAENGQQLSGVMDTTLVLTPDNLWLVNNSFRVGQNGHLIIKPGTQLIIYNNKWIDVKGDIQAIGTQDSLIKFTAQSYVMWGDAIRENESSSGRTSIIKYSVFENFSNPVHSYTGSSHLNVSYCTFFALNSIREGIGDFTHNICYFFNCNEIRGCRSSKFNTFIEMNTSAYTDDFVFMSLDYANLNKYNNFIRLGAGRIFGDSIGIKYQRNSFIKPRLYTVYSWAPKDFQYFRNQYWGTSDETKYPKMIYDFNDDPRYSVIIYTPYLIAPPDSCHGIVWKVLINGTDPQDQHLDALGIGPQKFQVYFNRPMDTAFHPQLSFGVRYPYNQQFVSDSGHWSNDHKIWTAWKSIQLYTGDGINRVRVAGARDLESFEIPIEDMRFEFVISAAGSASADFIAQAGIGKVYLEWNNAGIPDLLGFNIYRFKNITDTTYSAPVMINTSLITDTTYTDFVVTPGEHYWYYYKVVNTDFKESDSSHFASAIPYNAQVGDANGDGNVNVLDITALIAYMLNQNPQPFLFDAADVNNDKTINILDVIGVVNIITGKKKSISTTIVTNPMAAHIKLEDDRIILKNDGQIASMQFELAGESLENIKLSEPPKGFELAYGIVKGKLMGIIYTCSNQSLPAGSIPLIRINGMKSRLEWGKILAGDNEGNRVPVLKDEPTDQPNNLSYLQAYPNPFTQSVTINFRLPEDAKTEIKIFNMHGKLVNVLMNEDLKEGLHWVDWNGKSGNGNFLPAGIYMCTLEETNKKNDNFSKTIKLIFNR